MGDDARLYRADRHPAESYEDILDRDVNPAPAHLRQQPRWDAGTDAIPVTRFYDPAYFALEAKYLWSRIWQWACREEDIPNVGDYKIYEILDKSLIVVRSAPGQIKAFHNVCLHRGRQLVTQDGSKEAFRCPFHGMTWKCDGNFQYNPIEWDFPQWKDKDMRLPEVRVDTWSGYVFVNFDKDAAPLSSFIGPLADHFAPYDHNNRYVSVHIHKTIPANWKIVAEAFMESHHSLATHPQILPFIGDANSQYDILNDYVSRQFSAVGVPSPFMTRRLTQAEIIAEMGIDRGRQTSWVVEDDALPDGVSARTYMADLARRSLSAETGRDYSDVSDAEMIDPLLYNLFPHQSFWGGYHPTFCYRWRPLGTNPEKSIMEIFVMSPLPADGSRPAPAETRYVDEHMSLVTVEDLLGETAPALQQDMGNLPYVQKGLHASATGVLHYGRYSEGRIRHMYHMIQRYIDEGLARDQSAAG